jgi:tetratricopeptide (TPR) repeat protein
MGAWAIFYQGDLQRQLRNHKAAAAAYDRLDQRFAQESDPAVRQIVADALFKKGEALTELGDIRGAIAAYDEIDRRYAEDRDAGFRQRAVRALFTKGTLLGRQGAGEEPDSAPQIGRPDTVAAIAVYDDIVRRFGRDKDVNIRNIVGLALFQKSEALRLVGDDRGTIVVYDEIFNRFGTDNAQASRVLVATALFRRGLSLGRLEGASPATIGTYDYIIKHFAGDTNPNVRKIVGQAAAARQRLLSEAAASREAPREAPPEN